MTRGRARVRPGPLLGAIAGVALMLAGCQSAEKPIPVAAVTLTPSAAEIIATRTLPFIATAVDAKGTILSDRPITWSITPPTVAAVTAGGVVTAIAPGQASLVASSEGKSATATVTVVPIPVATVAVTPAAATLAIGATQALAATLRDADGNLLSDRVVTWTSSAPAVASVSTTGLVTATGAGVATITATSEGKAGTAAITAFSPTAVPVVAAITPATLTPGLPATITGQAFGSGDSLTVRVGGALARVTAFTPTQLAIVVPCVQSGPVEVRVTVGTRGGSRSHPLAAPQRLLAPGQAFIAATAEESACTELLGISPGARYAVAAYSTATSLGTLVDVELGGNAPATGADPPFVAAPARAAAPGPRPRDAEAERDAAHFAMLERDRALYAALRGRAATVPRAARVAARVAPPAVGDMRSAFFTYTAGCADTTRVIRARALYVGTRTIVWEDSANTLQATADSSLARFYARLGRVFDQEQYDAVKRTFGDPLLRDPLTDADGKVHMIFTQRLNGTGAAAYVTSCDQFPTASARGSNVGEYFYGFVPTTSGSNLENAAFPDGWYNFMARTVVHEVKHVASMAARVANLAPSFEQSWLEEGTARHAEEVWVRESLHKVGWKANTGYGTATTNGVYCDFHSAEAACLSADTLRRPGYGMRRHFNEIREKLVEPWNWSPYGTATGQSGSVFYQTAWSLVRYAIDRYGSSDAAFLTALTSATTNGVTNLGSVAGTTPDRIVGGWGLALLADDYPGLSNPSADVRFPTWNLRDIYAGLNRSPLWGGRWNVPYPIRATALPFGAFTAQQAGVRGGAHAFFELSGSATGTQVLALRDPSGGPASPLLRLAVVRLQ